MVISTCFSVCKDSPLPAVTVAYPSTATRNMTTKISRLGTYATGGSVVGCNVAGMVGVAGCNVAGNVSVAGCSVLGWVVCGLLGGLWFWGWVGEGGCAFLSGEWGGGCLVFR